MKCEYKYKDNYSWVFPKSGLSHGELSVFMTRPTSGKSSFWMRQPNHYGHTITFDTEKSMFVHPQKKTS